MNDIDYIYFSNGDIRYKLYYNENKRFHREDGPAVIGYYNNGNIEYEEYWINDIIHREDGPAFIAYNIDGEVEKIKWYYNYKNYTSRIICWINENNFNSYKEMAQDDFNKMWFEIL